MALASTTAYFPFAQGLDTKTDPKQVVPGKLITLQNGYFQTPGMIRKRPGFSALTSAALYSPCGLSTFKNELVGLDGRQLYTYDSTQGFVAKGYHPVSTLSTFSVAHGSSALNGVDSCYGNGYSVVTWRLSTTLYQYAIVNQTTGATVLTETVGSGNTGQPKVVAFNGYFVMVFMDLGTSNFSYQKVAQTSAPSGFGPSTTINAGSISTFDVAVNGSSQLLIASYGSTPGLYITTLSSAFVQNNKAIATESASLAIAVFPDQQTNDIWVAYSAGASLKTVVYSSDLLTQVYAPTVGLNTSNIVAITGTKPIGGSWAQIYYTVNGVSAYASFIGYTQLTGSSMFSDGVALNSHVLASKATSISFGSGKGYLALVMYASTVQPTYMAVIMVGTSVYPIAKIAPSLAQVGIGNYQTNGLPEMSAGPSSSYQVAYLQADQVLLNGATPGTFTYTLGARVALITPNSVPTSWIEAGNSLHAANGLIYAYDGLNVTEQNFHYYPDQVFMSPSSTGGSLGTGSYQVVVVYEWVDGQGQTHRSAPCLALTHNFASGSTNSLTVSWLPLNLTAKGDLVQAVIYRTTANGTIFYRDGAVYNSPGTTLQTYTCSSVDTTLEGQNQLYTTGEVENGAPPAALAVTAYKNRMIVVPSETPCQFWYSKQVVPGSPVEFSPFFTQNIDPTGGPITSVITMDDKLIVFKQTAVMAVVGDGPSASGQENDFSTGQLIASDVGALSAASVVLVPEGVMFQSKKGICLLTRGLEIQYIGAGVESYNSQGVMCATLYPQVNQARFVMSGGDTLVYDYLVGQWSVFTNPVPAQAVIWNSRYTYCWSNGLGNIGQTYQESATSFTDAGAFYALKVQTSWLSFAGIQGYQRVRRLEVLGDWKSAHTLQIEVAYDFDSTVMQTVPIPASVLVVPYQWELQLERQKCQALQLTIQDAQTTPYGEGLDISGLAFDIAVKSGLNRKAPSQSFG